MSHRSDCAVNNGPAFPNEGCNCWWLVSGETIVEVIEVLKSAVYHDWGQGYNQARETLHTLESGCHLTTEIPYDFQKEILKEE